MITPFPAARPSAFTTMGAPVSSINFLAGSTEVKRPYLAVGIWYLAHKSFINPFDPSNCAALADGPKTSIPSALRASASPSTSGASGPTTTRSMDFSFANCTSFSISPTLMGTHSACASMPAFPGAQYSVSQLSDCDNFHANACSRPPDPTNKIFMSCSCLPNNAPFIA